jgi:hypothetical protein
MLPLLGLFRGLELTTPLHYRAEHGLLFWRWVQDDQIVNFIKFGRALWANSKLFASSCRIRILTRCGGDTSDGLETSLGEDTPTRGDVHERVGTIHLLLSERTDELEAIG